MPTPVSLGFDLAPPPLGFDGDLAQLFALIAENLTGYFNQDVGVFGQGTILPTSNQGPFLYTALDPAQWYQWSTSRGKYVPDVTIPQPRFLGEVTHFHGSLGDILAILNPLGWFLADGGTYHGHVTANLTDRFIISAGATYEINTTGGSSSIGNHTHTLPGNTDSHMLAISEMPAHHHDFSNTIQFFDTGTAGGAQKYWAQAGGTAALTIADTGGGLGHTHGITGPTGLSGATSVLNPYYALFSVEYCGLA